jgi:hypothetical protein
MSIALYILAGLLLLAAHAPAPQEERTGYLLASGLFAIAGAIA